MRIHFISIGGSAMHSLAIALKKQGHEVSGSDDEIFNPSRGRLLEAGLLPEEMGWFPSRISTGLDAVVLGMHARAENPELKAAERLGVRIYSYPEFIYEQSRNKFRVVIGGSHGKTSCTSMIMHVLKSAGLDFDYLVGAKLEGFEDSVRMTQTAPIILIEGDEYLSSPIDRRPKFILYRAHLALLTGIAWDHVNVFPTFELYCQQFTLFLKSLEPRSTLVYCSEDLVLDRLVKEFMAEPISSIGKIYPYSAPDHIIRGGQTFLVEADQEPVSLLIFGHHNLLNLQGAWLICHELGVDKKQFLTAINTFTGASKRMERIASNAQTSIYMDFAHAPSKLKATISALKEQYPARRLVAVMELHTFSSLNPTFLAEYRSSMDAADLAIVYFNPETLEHKKLPPLDVGQVHVAFARQDLQVMSGSEELLHYLKSLDLAETNLVFMSSGNFDGLDIRGFAARLN